MANMDLGPETLIGTWRRFGVAGPVYEVIGGGTGASSPTPLMRVRVLESGEELDYKLADLLADPVER
jgi:hypothetical protein